MYFQNTVSVVPIYSPNDRAQNWLIFKLSNIFDSQREACFEILVNTEVKQTGYSQLSSDLIISWHKTNVDLAAI